MVFPNDQPGVSPIIEYLGHHPVRPKEEIGRAMAELGFSVPRIFESLDDAIASGMGFIARSEGADELYHSGLKLSIASTDRYYDEGRLRNYIHRLTDPERSYTSLSDRKMVGSQGVASAEIWRLYLNQSAEDGVNHRDEFARLHSLSFWQLARGDNFYIVGDTTNPNKLYMGRTTTGKRSFSIIDDGTIAAHHPSPWDAHSEGLPDVKKLSEFYTNVRNAAPFDPRNAAIVECSDPGNGQEIQFLQYLPTQPFLDELPVINSSQSDVLFVRGGTPPAGIRGHITKSLDHAATVIQRAQHPIINGDDPFNPPLSEFVLPRADAVLIHPVANLSPGYFTEAMGLNTVDHGGRSLMFKPKVTIALSKTAMDFLERRQQERPYQPISLHIRADGIHAEVRASLGDRVVELHRLMDQVHENSGF